MKAIIETPTEVDAIQRREFLLEDYRQALREWSRARHSSTLCDQVPEVVAAINRIETLEQQLKDLACNMYKVSALGAESRIP